MGVVVLSIHTRASPNSGTISHSCPTLYTPELNVPCLALPLEPRRIVGH